MFQQLLVLLIVSCTIAIHTVRSQLVTDITSDAQLNSTPANITTFPSTSDIKDYSLSITATTDTIRPVLTLIMPIPFESANTTSETVTLTRPTFIIGLQYSNAPDYTLIKSNLMIMLFISVHFSQ